MRIWNVISPKFVRNSNVKTWLSYRVPGPTHERTAFVNSHSLRMAPTTSSMHVGPIKSGGVLSLSLSSHHHLAGILLLGENAALFLTSFSGNSSSPAPSHSHFSWVPLCSCLFFIAQHTCALSHSSWVWFYQGNGCWGMHLKMRHRVGKILHRKWLTPCCVISNHFL